MDYIVAIPSHNRVNKLKENTLELLDFYNIPKNKIYIFVAEDQIELYNKELDNENTFKKSNTKDEGGYNLRTGILGIKENRKSISDYFNENQFIVSLDDDIKDILILKETILKPIESLLELIKTMYNSLKQNNCNLGGLYPIDNPYFMKDTITTDLRFIIGNVKFFFNKKFLENRKFTLLEDYETTLKYYLYDNKVIRYNNIVASTNYKILKWGLTQTDKNKEVELFNNKYPNYSSIKYKKNNNTDISLKRNPKRITLSTLWIKNPLNELAILSIKSWLRQGYLVDLYTDLDHLQYVFLKNNKITIKDPNTICSYTNNDILAYSDYWRYNLLLKLGTIWIDADMVLLDQIPNRDIIISSEATFQSGAFKSLLPNVPNIGLLKFNTDLGRDFLQEVIDNIYLKVEQSVFTDNMKIFRTKLKKKKYKELYDSVLPYYACCGVSWWNTAELYYDKNYSTKYSVIPIENDYIINNSISVHLWNNFTYNKYKIDFTKIYTMSLYSRLLSFF
tara:strand:+ start:1141 stop:2658 length:1518 start_codon:yes stop_codon:yes gene_type:complete